MWRLRIFTDRAYPAIIAACKAAINEVCGRPAGQMQRPIWQCDEIYSDWKHWICLFPQHGPGRKHLREITLQAWQWRLIECFPEEFVKGLVHSDGSRVTNNVRNRLGVSYSYPRYFFSNRSDEIRALFIKGCDLLGVEARHNNRYSVSVARRHSVAILDEFIGPKR
ncbi:MAG TPA: hypothetical protein VEX62_02560 [Candidatus Limnocylindrales bacterium]|nr:hypothetical protein [Candidatus Limnocylindrales bacterium]